MAASPLNHNWLYVFVSLFAYVILLLVICHVKNYVMQGEYSQAKSVVVPCICNQSGVAFSPFKLYFPEIFPRRNTNTQRFVCKWIPSDDLSIQLACHISTLIPFHELVHAH